MESVIEPFYRWHGLLLALLSLIAWHMPRRGNKQTVKPVYYLLCVVVATAPITKLFSVAAKYDMTIYDVNEAVVSSSGETVNLLDLTTIPVILSFIVAMILIVCAIMLHIMKRKET